MKNICEKLVQRFKELNRNPDIAKRFCEGFETAIIQVLKEHGEVKFSFLGKMTMEKLPKKRVRMPDGTITSTKGLKTIKFKVNYNLRRSLNQV